MSSHQTKTIIRGVGSVFLLWHVSVLVFATVPENSYLRNKLQPLFSPYMTLLHLFNNWHFYAPDPRTTGHVLRYQVQTASGARVEFSLSEDRARLDPAFFRYTVFSSALVFRGAYQNFASASQYLCRRHAELNPQSIFFTANFQQPYTREDYFAGLQPLDAQFLHKVDAKIIPCGERG